MRVVTTRLILTMLLALLGAGAAKGQTILEGEVGTDLGVNNLNNYLMTHDRNYDVDRSLSRQYLGLSFSGPLGTSDFADVALRARLAGTYMRVRNYDDGTLSISSEYIDPMLDNVLGSFSLFPLRTYPFRYTFGKITTTTNRYEPGRRADVQTDSPGLAVLRRYESDVLSHAAQWQLSRGEKFGISAEVRHEENEIRRAYDFDENRDIWVNFSSSNDDPSPIHTVDILNSLNDVVIIVIDGTIADTLSAGELGSIDVPAGLHELDVVPSYYNPFNTEVNVRSTMLWRIIHTPPKGSSDLDQTTDSAEAVMRIGGQGRFRNDTRFLYSDIFENVQNMTSTLSSLNNQASFYVRPGLDLHMLSTYASNATDITDVSSQTTSSLLHQTEGRWKRRQGGFAALSHSYNLMRSKTQSSDLQSQTNIFNGLASLPTGRVGHILDLRGTANLLADSEDYSNYQYTGAMVNKFDMRQSLFKLRPQHGLKYTRAYITSVVSGQGVLSKSTEIESRLSLDGERPRMPLLPGDLRVRGEWEWRSRDSRAETEVKNRIFGEIGLVMKVSRNFRILGSVSREAELYSVESKEVGPDGQAREVIRPDQERMMYRLDVQAQPATSLTFGANGMLIRQKTSRISRLSLTMSGRLPFFGFPLRSFLVAESKGLDGLGNQSLLEGEVQLSHHFRKISVVAAYSIYREKLISEHYTYSEFYIKISRAFDFI
jgi:hypothetical protein